MCTQLLVCGLFCCWRGSLEDNIPGAIGTPNWLMQIGTKFSQPHLTAQQMLSQPPSYLVLKYKSGLSGGGTTTLSMVVVSTDNQPLQSCSNPPLDSIINVHLPFVSNKYKT